MLARLGARLTYANVTATLALFLALGGGAYAALKLPANSVGTTQLKKNAVTGPKVKNRSLTAVDVAKHQFLRPADKAANADRLDGADSSSFVRHGDAAGGVLAGKYPAPALADGAVGPQQASFTGYARQNGDVPSSFVVKALEVTVQVPRQRMLIAVYANGDLKTSNAAHTASVNLIEQDSAGGITIGRVFATTSTSYVTKQTAPGSSVGVINDGTTGGGWIAVPTGLLTGTFKIALLVESDGAAVSTLKSGAELYATVLP